MNQFKLRWGLDGYKEYARRVKKIDSRSLYEHFVKLLESKKGTDWIKNNFIKSQLRYAIVPVLMEKLRENRVPSEIVFDQYSVDEATPALDSMAKSAGVSLKDAERYWDEAKAEYMKTKNKKEKDLKDSDYRYIMGVVKNRMKLAKDKKKESLENKTNEMSKNLDEQRERC
jgi:Sec-independent protein translocase protein TatA